jgi:hypothetical protein
MLRASLTNQLSVELAEYIYVLFVPGLVLVVVTSHIEVETNSSEQFVQRKALVRLRSFELANHG